MISLSLFAEGRRSTRFISELTVSRTNNVMAGTSHDSLDDSCVLCTSSQSPALRRGLQRCTEQPEGLAM